MTSAERGARNSERGTANMGYRRPQFRAPRSALRACVAGFATICLASIAAAQSPPAEPRLVEIRVGFDQHYKLGCWTAVELTFTGGSERLTGIVALTTLDGDGTPVVQTSPPVQLTPGRSTPVVVYAKFGKLDGEATVTFIADGKKRVEEKIETGGFGGSLALPMPLSTEDRLVVCVGSMPTLNEAAASLDLDRSRVVVALVLDPARLPAQWLAYEAVDAVVVAPDRPETFAGLPPDGAQVAALVRWLQLGGRVWAAVSDATAPSFVAGAALHQLGAGKLGPSTSLPRTTALEKLAGADTLQSIAAVDLKRKPLLIPRLEATDAVVDAVEGDLPLVLRRAAGLGTLLVTTFHPEHPLLSSWTGRQSVVRNMLVDLGVLSKAEAAAAALNQTNARTPAYARSHYGYTDLAGQLRSALDQYTGVQVVSFFALALMVLGYLVLVGPVDYWFVRRVLKRPEMTWITFPTIVVATSLGAYYLAVWLKGNELRVSRADVVDCDAATGTMRTTSWAGVFSPVGRTYDVRFPATSPLVAATDVESTTTWFGLPGSGLGAMHARGGGGWFSQSYVASTGDAGLGGVPIQVWSSKMFMGCRTAHSRAPLHAPLSTDGDGRLRGKVQNPFAYDLEEAVLCYGTQAYEIGTLKVGATHDVAALNGRDLESVLQNRHVVMSANKNPLHVGQAHDPGSRDVAEILRKMMFFAAAGGDEHAALENRFQSRLDLSSLILMRRAVLVGRVDPAAIGDLQLLTSGGEASRGGETRTSFVRLVIPVNASDSGR